jgi:excisionase family DNA binding protein
MNDIVHPFPGLEPVLTTSELAAHLGVPVQTIHDLRHSGRGPRGFRVGRELRYRLSEVQDWLAQLEKTNESGRETERVRS